MNSLLYPAQERGHANHGWLNSYHSFSFAQWYHADKTNFGVLRVLNDDEVAPGTGFGTHPHQNMEIISIPLKGSLLHEDSMGHRQEIPTGDVQVMSAGTGLEHSEYNASKDEPVHFLQIWIIPEQANVAPRYAQKTFPEEERQNKMQMLVGPRDSGEDLWIHQKAWLSLGHWEAGQSFEIALRNPQQNGLYLFAIEGELHTLDKKLLRRDALGVWGGERLQLTATKATQLLAIEVPLALPG